ncbi:hypothetical protein, partial [Streptomyces sp. NPDC056632]|uniref:hypothetical protein n=1 Tax=Streptomyces sp. NPDC056632 TaxID=3345884 RepID=UPI003674D604
SGGTGNGLEMTLDEVDQYADLPLFSELVIDAALTGTSLTGTVLEPRPPAGTNDADTNDIDGPHDPKTLGRGSDAGEEDPAASRTGKGKRRAVVSDSESDPEDDSFGNRFAKAGPVVFNDWTEGEEEQENPELAFIWAGFQTVLEASPLQPTDIASPGIPGPGTGTGPQPHEDDPAFEEDDPLGQTPQHTPQETPGERTGGGVWQEYLDELHHLPAGVESEGRDQAVQTLQDLIADTAFGGPFPQDIAAAHPLLLQHSPAYRTHFTAFQHTHTAPHADMDVDMGEGTGPAVTLPVPDSALRGYWTTLTTRPPSPPDQRTTPPDTLNGQTAGLRQGIDVNDGQQHTDGHTPATPRREHDDHLRADDRVGSHDAAMQTEDDQPHSPQADPEESDAEAQPSAWERYLDATATLPDGPSTQQLRQLLQSLIDGT